MTGLILDHLWQSTLFAAIAGLLVLTLRKNSANIRYYLWFAASAKFLLPFTVLTALGGYLSGLIASPISAPRLFVLDPMARPFSGNALSLATPAPGFDLVQIVTPLLLALWAIGFVAIAARWLLRWSRLQRVLREAVDCPIIAPVKVKIAPSMLEPGLVGILRPVILLPQGITERLSQEEMNAVLAHEICHLRRRDNLLAATHMLVEALFWFHPLVWWVGARLNEEREHACDESVLAAGQTPQIYAESILKVCQFYLASPLDCAAGISGADLKRRMETIMESKFSLRLNAAKKILLAGAAAIAIAAPIAAGLLTAPLALAQTSAAQTTAKPSPGTEAALRRNIEGLYTGQPPYDIMLPGLVDATHQQLTNLEKNAKTLGALKSLTFQNVNPDGYDVYAAVYEHGSATWLIAPLRDGKMGGLLFTSIRIAGQAQHPGTEASVRRYVESLEKGEPNYEEMSPGMADTVRQQLPQILATIKPLGALKSVTFVGGGPMDMDAYEVTFEHGKAEWDIAPLDANGKVVSRGFHVLN